MPSTPSGSGCGAQRAIPLLDRHSRIVPLEIVPFGDAELLPAGVAHHHVARLPTGCATLDHLRYGAADDSLAGIVGAVHEPGTHVRVQAQPPRAQQHFAGCRWRQRFSDYLEVIGTREPDRLPSHSDHSIHRSRHIAYPCLTSERTVYAATRCPASSDRPGRGSDAPPSWFLRFECMGRTSLH